MRQAVGSFVLSLSVLSIPGVALADVDVTTSIDLTQVQISATNCATCSVQLTPTFANAYGSVFDSLGGAATGIDFFESGSASASASTTLATWSGAADSVALTASTSSAVHIHDPIAAEAGTVPGGNYGDLGGPPGLSMGTFEILDSSGGINLVTVSFSASVNGDQELTTDASGVSATSEVTFFLVVGATQELFLDSPLAIGPSSSLSSPFSTTLNGSDTLLTNSVYSFETNVDAESYGLNTPEPSYSLLTGCACLLLLARRLRRTKYNPLSNL